MDVTTLKQAKKYTDATAAQFGGLKGANCKLGTIADITSGGAVIGQKVPFIWKNDDDETQTSNMDIMYSDIANMVLAQLPTAESIEV